MRETAPRRLKRWGMILPVKTFCSGFEEWNRDFGVEHFANYCGELFGFGYVAKI